MGFPNIWKILFRDEGNTRILNTNILPNATSNSKGVVLLSDETSSSGIEESVAITPKAVKTALDGSAVKYSVSQELTDAQKAQARNNIDAPNVSSVVTLSTIQTITGAKTFTSLPQYTHFNDNNTEVTETLATREYIADQVGENVQAHNVQLDNLAAFNNTGLIARAEDGTIYAKTITNVAGDSSIDIADAGKDGFTLKLSNTGVTIGSYGPTANVTGTDGATINVPQITVDAQGRISSIINRTYTSKNTTNFLPLSGGTLTGAFNTPNNVWNNLGDDASFGDHNVGGKMCIKTQTSTATGIAFFNSGDTNVGQVEVNNVFTFNKEVHATSFQATSDIRKKENLEEIKNINLSSLGTYSYNFKDDKEHRKVGLIAQEVEKICPEAVTTGEDGFKSLDYNAVVALLVAKVNELEKKYG
jgi:hypothetical protein